MLDDFRWFDIDFDFDQWIAEWRCVHADNELRDSLLRLTDRAPERPIVLNAGTRYEEPFGITRAYEWANRLASKELA